MNNKVAFEKNWTRFIGKYKAKMLEHTKVRKITFDVATNTLLDVLSDWGSEYEEGGRWLKIYCDRYQYSGKKICDILEGIELEPAKKPKGLKREVIIMAPVVVAFITAVTGILFKWGWFFILLGIVVSAFVTGGVVKTINDSIKTGKEKDIINFYVKQVNGYKQSISELIE